MNTQQGVTLVELLVSLAVAAILLSQAVPAFRETIIQNRLTTFANTFIGAVNYARSEAIRRGQGITLCKSNSGSACTTTGTQWENGWIAFVDTNTNGSLDSGEILLRAWPALPSDYTLRTNSSNFANFIRYNALGAVANNSVGGTFAICYKGQRVGARAIVMSALRPRLGIDANKDRIPENDSGNIASCFLS